MTWHHVAMVLIAASMVMVCIISSACAASPGAFQGVVTVATAIVAFAAGNATSGVRIPDTERKEPQDK